MSWGAVHQFVPTLIRGDANGDHVVRLRDQQRHAGRRSEIFVDVERDATASDTHPLRALDDHTGPDTLLVYHVAQASRCAPFLIDREEPLALLFHNFTPVDLLAGWDPSAACDLLDAERQLSDLADRALLGICDSHYNAERLADHGMLHTPVACIPVESRQNDHSEASTRPTVLFVGRVAPNKAFHDLIAAVAVLVQSVPQIELRLVGGETSLRYTRALEGLITALGLDDTVTLTGRVSDAQLVQEYQRASVFCCLSDHEGFGVPLLEAMSHGCPLVAFDSSAVGETVGGAGLLLSDKSPTVVAGALERVLAEADLAEALRTAGLERAASFSEERCAAEIGEALALAWSLSRSA